MNSLRTYAILWLSGLIAGVIVMERWRRTGKRLIPPPSSAHDDAGTPSASSASMSSGGTPKVTWVLVTGARSDAARVHQFVKRVTPWTSTPAPWLAEAQRRMPESEPGRVPHEPA